MSHDYDEQSREELRGRRIHQNEVYSQRVPAGKRTYFFDVKTTRSGEDFFLTITESKRVSETRWEKHKLFLYKEDFGKFVNAMLDAVEHVQCELLPDFDFRDLPDLASIPRPSAEDNRS